MKTALATQPQNTKVTFVFSDLTRLKEIKSLTDENLFCGLRLTRDLAQPYCQEFIDRFNAAKALRKKAKKDDGGYFFHGFKNFDRAARAKTGYTGAQVRNLAKGKPSGTKPATAPPLSLRANADRAKIKELNAILAAKKEERAGKLAISNLESQIGKASVPDILPATPVVISPSQPNPAAARLALDNDEMLLLLQRFAYATDDKSVKSVHKLVVAFLKSHNALNEPPPLATPPSRRPPLGIKSTPASEIKAEPSQAKPDRNPGDGFVPDGSMTIGHMYSENSKGTGLQIEFVTPEQHEALQRGPGVV